MTASPQGGPEVPTSGGLLSRAVVGLWLSMLTSWFGGAVLTFAIGVALYERTGQVTPVVLTQLFAIAPGLILSPIAGHLTDRVGPRRLMGLERVSWSAFSLMLAFVFLESEVALWAMYLAVAGHSAFEFIQSPPLMALLAHGAPSRELTRRNGAMQVAIALSEILGPLTCGFLLAPLGLTALVWMNFGLSLTAVAALAMVPRTKVPIPPAVAAPRRLASFRDLGHTWSFLGGLPGLRSFLALELACNAAMNLLVGLIGPMVLSLASASVLGRVVAAAGVGALVASVGMVAVEGPSRRVRPVQVMCILSGLVLVLTGWTKSPWLIGAAAFTLLALRTLSVAYGQSVWQQLIPPDRQGRVFAARQTVFIFAGLLTYAAMGPLVDWVFEPLLMPGGAWASTVGGVIGVGPGRGISVLVLLIGVGIALVGGVSLFVPRLQHLDQASEARPASPGAV
ncbi:MFS transporter [Corallococcus sp. BB11-1]|uniref:MFS transporter n=1 Tax=Corallococcus sp. BB11-1 TaxID=2996783 RepID=UPI002271E690|nr:MFS transporter [Corallococcus sp. BB11-1]MCY1035341.1 MFS transporter [Corallococcus sp. BB11-1]